MANPAEVADHDVDAYLTASAIPVRSSHASGTLDEARERLRRSPALPKANIFTAAVSGDVDAVRVLLTEEPSRATIKGGPHHWDALTWCCFSRWLRDERERAPHFTAVAQLLLDAGASANTGFHDPGPGSQWESALYGAAGVAFCAPLAALLLRHGADPNDDEVPYHAAEQYAHDVVAALLASPTPLSRDSLATLLLRKADWHDTDGVRQLLHHGVNPGYAGRWPITPLEQSIRRDNDLAIIELLVDALSAPRTNGASHSDAAELLTKAASIAAWHGRTDVLQLLAERGVELPHSGIDAIAVDSTFGDFAGVRARLAADATHKATFYARLPEFVGRCAANGALAPLGVLLQLAPSIDVRWRDGDGYWDIAPESTPLIVAAWRARHSVVSQLLDAGADVHATDARGRTALRRAVDACVHSYWQSQRRPTSVALLLEAGAQRDEIALPTGYDEIDRLLRAD